MTAIALFGAGGKMGYRLASNLRGSRFSVRHVEVAPPWRSPAQDGSGRGRVSADAALNGADVVILAVPDTHIGKVAAGIDKQLKAAPDDGHGARRRGALRRPPAGARPDLTYFVTHPCHPPIFNDETEMAAKRDHFGGVSAKQHIVSALMQGPESAYALGEEIAKVIWAPVMRSHRVTVEQMALLEPGLSETVCATLLDVMREAMDEVVARGVPREAARDFLLGHMNVLGAVIFGEVEGVFSDACNKAIEFGKPTLMRPDWKKVFEPQEIADSIQRIHPGNGRLSPEDR